MTKTRIANRRYSAQQRRSAGSGGGWRTVVVGFAIICGLLLLLLGRGAGCAGGGDRAATARQVLDALQQANKADQALEQKNYGEARYHVKSAQEKLTGVLTELQEEVDR